MHPPINNSTGNSRIKRWFSAKFRTDSATGSIIRNMAVLASGTMIAKIIGLIAMPVIARIYTPEHFGVLSVFASLISLLVPFCTLRFSAAIPLPKQDGTAANLFTLCLVLLTIVSALTGLILWLFGPAILTKLSMRELVPYWWLLLVAIVGAGIYEILYAWATRAKAFKLLAKIRIWQAISSALVKIGLGLWGFKPLGLLIGLVISQAWGWTSLAADFYPKLKMLSKQVSVKRILFVFNRYSDFLKYRLPSQFLEAFAVSAPLIFSAMMFGKEATGQLGLALSTLALPIALFGNTTGQAYYAEISRIGRKDPNQILLVTKRVIKRLFLLSIPPSLLLLLTGPWLFSIVFGENWHDAGTFARILAIYLLAQFISTPVVNVFNVFDRQILFLWINIFRCLIIAIVFGISMWFDFSSFVTIFIYAVSLFCHYLFTLKLVLLVIPDVKQHHQVIK